MRMIATLVAVACSPVLLSADTSAWPGPRPGERVGVSVEVEGQTAPLYPARDGSGRFYLEARAGSRYAVSLTNRTPERVGVVLVVDGLNVITGEPSAGPGRMYVLDPWDSTTIRGWRTSLQEIRRFNFVDERRSYATRSGQANDKMGWIEVAVYQERRPTVYRRFDDARPGRESENAPPAAKAAPEGRSEQPSDGAEVRQRADGLARGGNSYPGTGWGERTADPVVLVNFTPQPVPVERISLRYEYARALQALGILPRQYPNPDRLSERDRGGAFAKPPAW